MDGQTNSPTLNKKYTFQIPQEYLKEPDYIPEFWITTVDDVNAFLKSKIHKGTLEIIGTSAGGRPVYAVTYGKARMGKGTTTFSGSLGYGDAGAYRGPSHDKVVYMGIAGVHGGEFEGIMGMVNFLNIIETGKDLIGREWPEISSLTAKLDRLILIPMLNPDGRARIPLRMEAFRGPDLTVAEYFSTGGKPDGSITGWPQVKKFIPVDLNQPGFPGGYPNDAGVNIQHDDFFGKRQPETQALLNLAGRERPDLILNMHTGAVYMLMHRPFAEPVLNVVFDSLFRSVHSQLALNGLQATDDPKIESDPYRAPNGVFNLDGVLNLHCGALSIVVESPSHCFARIDEGVDISKQTPERLLDAQLICYQEFMRFLANTGGRSQWTPGR